VERVDTSQDHASLQQKTIPDHKIR